MLLTLKSEAVDPSIPRNSELFRGYYSHWNKAPDQFQIKVSAVLRACIRGEELTEQGACKRCVGNTYLIEPPKKVTACKVCPSQQAFC